MNITKPNIGGASRKTSDTNAGSVSFAVQPNGSKYTIKLIGGFTVSAKATFKCFAKSAI